MTPHSPESSRDEKPFDLVIRIGLLGLLIYWAFTLVRPFIVIVLWSIILAVALYPSFEWLADRLGERRRLAAILMTVTGLLVTLGPVTWLGLGLVENGRALYDGFMTGDIAFPPPPPWIKAWPLVGEPIFQTWELASSNLKAAFIRVAPELRPFGATLLGVAGSTGLSILSFLASVLLAGFLFAPAPSLVAAIRAFARRVHDDRGEQFVVLAGATIRNVSRGVIGIAVIQAVLAGIGLVGAGVPGASLITFAVLFLAIVQIGAAVVLLPLIAWSWMTMDAQTALLFTAYMVPVNVIDNVLRPIVLGRGLQTPMLVIFIGVIGGTLAHGLIGLFVGPIVLAVCWDLLSVWVGWSERPDAGGPAPPPTA